MNAHPEKPRKKYGISEYSSLVTPSLPISVIRSVIEIQKENQHTSISEKYNSGFLVTCFTPDELNSLYSLGSSVYTLSSSDEVIGFAMTTPLSVYSKQFLEPGSSYKELLVQDTSNSTYFYQLATRRDLLHSGIGSNLLKYIQATSITNVIADVLTSPLNNVACISFLKKHSFFTIGEMHLTNYRDFGPLVSEVLFWKKP